MNVRAINGRFFLEPSPSNRREERAVRRMAEALEVGDVVRLKKVQQKGREAYPILFLKAGDKILKVSGERKPDKVQVVRMLEAIRAGGLRLAGKHTEGKKALLSLVQG